MEVCDLSSLYCLNSQTSAQVYHIPLALLWRKVWLDGQNVYGETVGEYIIGGGGDGDNGCHGGESKVCPMIAETINILSRPSRKYLNQKVHSVSVANH